MFNLPQITQEQLDDFLDEMDALHSVAEFLTEDGEIDYEKLHAAAYSADLTAILV